MGDQKLNLNINSGEIEYLGATSWRYGLLIRVHDWEIQNFGSNMADWNNNKI